MGAAASLHQRQWTMRKLPGGRLRLDQTSSSSSARRCLVTVVTDFLAEHRARRFVWQGTFKSIWADEGSALRVSRKLYSFSLQPQSAGGTWAFKKSATR